MKNFLLTCCMLATAMGASSQQVEHLRCEHLDNPLGIDSPQPRLSWQLQDERNEARQIAYQILVDTDSLAILNNKSEIWNSGKRNNSNALSAYEGEKLEPFTKYYWKVKLWDKDGKEIVSDIANFETGMMNIGNWTGTWISDHNDINHKEAPYFRKEFDAKKTIKSARAYISAAGLYELSINGKKVGDHELDPLYTRFDRRNFYVTYDVTQDLQQGKNAIGVILGNGWYNHQSLAVWNFHTAPWRNRPTFVLDVRITYTDGTTETICSENDWKTSSGELVFNSIYTAEHYDATKKQSGWDTPNFDDSAWKGIRYRAVPSQNVVAQQVEPIRSVEIIKPIKFSKIDNKTYIYDLGRNIAGVSEIKLNGKAGIEVRVKHGERLFSNGRIDISNIDVYHLPADDTDPFQVDIITLDGKGESTYKAKFNYKGFRYVEVTSSEPIELSQDDLIGHFTHSDVSALGEIKSSNELINKLWWATNNAYLSNLMGYPTDCPQREKNGWTGDGHFAIETALYNFDGITVYEKWLNDHRDEQQPNGVLPDIIPTGGWGYGTANGVDWTSTIAIIPWNIYMFYGDSKILADCYDNIKRYVNYIDRTSPNHLTSWGRGDWVPVKSQSSLELTSSVYFYVDAQILAKAAKLFGKNDDYEYYSQLADKIKDAINNKYLDKQTGIYASGTQTELSVPLQWGIVPSESKPLVVKNLAQKVKDAGFHLDVGVLGAKAILNALSENGEAETAYKIAAQDTYPSWGWWIVNGATTLLENWDLEAERDISDNHMMFGEIGAWFFKGLGGIFPDEAQPGFKHIILKPNFVNDLPEFEASFKSPYGKIVSSWKRKKKDITWNVTIPANSTATFYLPDNVQGSEREIKLSAGQHNLKLKLK